MYFLYYNREFISSNVDVNRLVDNITYVREDIREVYNEMFGEALQEYNAKQTRRDRKIHDYFEHIQADERNETLYEVVIQFGCSETAPVGSENGELVKKMLDEYMQGFSERNKNMRVFNACLHADESSYHLHIDFVPFYTQSRKSGLYTGVSMKAALTEQGFSNKHVKANSLIEWQNTEMKVMESILNNHNLERDVKNAKHKHQSVPEYKASQDWKKLPKRKKNLTTLETYNEDLKATRQENSMLKVENEKLIIEKHSLYKSFFYGDMDKQNFVQSKLDELAIPYRESDNGIEAKACYVEQIRSIEKQYRIEPITHRNKLRDTLDKIVMQVKDYDDIFEKLKALDYEIKFGKYTAVKPKDGDRFIRIKSLGEMYSEQALRNRIINRDLYEVEIDKKLDSIESKQSLEYRYQLTVKQYILTFKVNKLPARKVNPKQPFTFINDVELDRLARLNKKINEGVTLNSLQNDLMNSNNNIARMERRIDGLRSPAGFDKNLFEVAERWYDSPTYRRSREDLEILERYEYTSDKYFNQKRAIADSKTEIAKIEKSISEEREKIRPITETLNAFEKIVSMTYVDSLVVAEKNRKQAAKIGNGIKSADLSIAESQKVDEVVKKVVEVVEKKPAEPDKPIYIAPKRK
jgi:hypothetical protein